MDVNLITYLLLGANAAFLAVVIFWASRPTNKPSSQAPIGIEKARDDFLAMISHEIRTPLNGIIGFADILSRSDLDESQKDSVRNIQESGSGLLRILNDILDMSKARAGKLQTIEEAVDIKAVIKSVFDLFRPLYQKNHNRVSLRISEGLPNFILSDEIRLRQILSNLLSNAAKFTQNGSVTCDVRCDDNSLILTVADTGIGINPARQAAIFEPFEQESESISRQFGGTGLGLSITKHIIEAMGGHIVLVSELGQGSQFTVTLPLKPCEEISAPVEEDDNDAPFFHHHILVVEDIPMNQNLICAILEKRGCTVVVAENGSEALQMIKDHVFDAVLMDVRMPVMDGLEATQKIRSNFGSSLLPIIGMTAHADAVEIKNCLEAGMDEVLTKPIQAKDVYKCLAEWLYRDDGNFTVAMSDHDSSLKQNLESFDILNTIMIDQFIEFLGMEGFRGAVTDTEIDVRERIQKIKDHSYAFKLMQDELHAMSSIVGNIGLNRLSQFCRPLIQMEGAPPLNELQGAINDFETLWKQSRETLEYYLTRK